VRVVRGSARRWGLLLAAMVFGSACGQTRDGGPPGLSAGATEPGAESTAEARLAQETDPGGTSAAPALEAGQAEAILAGGCFWCMEGPLEAIDGVLSVTSGYTGGHEEHPRYEAVGTSRTGHVEAVRVVYDPSRVRYEQLLEVYWRNVDPTQDDGQFCDRGPQYRAAIFVRDESERALATASRAQVARALHAEVVTEIRDAAVFWVAEDYHQDYYRTHPTRYQTYRQGCGRDRRLEALWGESAAH